MKILQLGNGGGLNPLLTNSSFLIDLYDDGSSYLLFDCGFNIMQRLIKLEEEDESFKIENIDYVFLSHTHDDHVGNYETLCFWNFFKNNKVMKTLCGSENVKNYILTKPNEILEAGVLKKTSLFKPTLIVNRKQLTSKNNLTILLIEGNHGANISHGIIITSKSSFGEDKQMIYISGDTKAIPSIENNVMQIYSLLKPNSSIFFHDFSNWNAPTRNVHACEADFTIEYTEEFQNMCIKYHTGTDDFNKEWQLL